MEGLSFIARYEVAELPLRRHLPGQRLERRRFNKDPKDGLADLLRQEKFG